MKYTFDDEVISKFCYDIINKKIEIYFEAYYDLNLGESLNQPCILIIENWVNAKSKFVGDAKFHELEKHLGIFSMILSLEEKNDDLEIIVNTINNTYLELIFIKPHILFKK